MSVILLPGTLKLIESIFSVEHHERIGGGIESALSVLSSVLPLSVTRHTCSVREAFPEDPWGRPRPILSTTYLLALFSGKNNAYGPLPNTAAFGKPPVCSILS